MLRYARTIHIESSKIVKRVDTNSLPPPIEVTTLELGAISFGSEIHVQWSSAQCAFAGIGLVLFQLTSEWNWLAGAPW
jgi:hypothetical protein